MHAATYEWSNVAPLAMQFDRLKNIYVRRLKLYKGVATLVSELQLQK